MAVLIDGEIRTDAANEVFIPTSIFASLAIQPAGSMNTPWRQDTFTLGRLAIDRRSHIRFRYHFSSQQGGGEGVFSAKVFNLLFGVTLHPSIRFRCGRRVAFRLSGEDRVFLGQFFLPSPITCILITA